MMGLREVDIRAASDLPAIKFPDCRITLYARGEVPEDLAIRLKFALSRHYGRALEYLSFTMGEATPQDSATDMIIEVVNAGFRLAVAGSETPQMKFYIGTVPPGTVRRI